VRLRYGPEHNRLCQREVDAQILFRFARLQQKLHFPSHSSALMQSVELSGDLQSKEPFALDLLNWRSMEKCPEQNS
jgi:hypothetical protein